MGQFVREDILDINIPVLLETYDLGVDQFYIIYWPSIQLDALFGRFIISKLS